MTKRGLIVGKFYPPHRGHKYLIDSARSQVDELSVFVCCKPEEMPRGELRAAWLQEIHPDVRVMLIVDNLDPDDSKVWAEHSILWLGFVPDVVFTSEDYGDRFAYYLGCEHVQVDKARIHVPISGTRVRANPLGCWDFLEPPVRAYYTKRICLIGAESTGKTTLAQALAAYYKTAWVPEYGRVYSESKLVKEGCYDWHSEEFVHIAQTQCEHEEKAARLANKVLICDTDAFATSIWHHRYMGYYSPEVEAIAANHRIPDLYLLTDINTPFVQDGTRDGELIRREMHETFISKLTGQGRPFHYISGSPQKRFNQAVEYIDKIIAALKIK